MSTPSIRRIEAQSPEIPYLENFLDNSAISGGFSESGAPPAVPHRYDWMWLERWHLGASTRLFAVMGSNPRNETSNDDEEIISSLRNGARVFLNLGETSIVEIGLGDYGDDGVRDILLRLSDGAFLLITPSEESPASRRENPPTATEPPVR